MGIDFIQLSKTVSHGLRHQPWVYELELDKLGWTDVEPLLDSLQRQRPEWASLTQENLCEMVAASDKPRQEIRNGRIRVLAGSSLSGGLRKTAASPPDILYHGTSAKSADELAAEGLLPQKRHYVHLSTDIPTAREVAKRKGEPVAILRIDAKSAAVNGVRFYAGNARVWLADQVPAEYIEQLAAQVDSTSV